MQRYKNGKKARKRPEKTTHVFIKVGKPLTFEVEETEAEVEETEATLKTDSDSDSDLRLRLRLSFIPFRMDRQIDKCFRRC